MCARSKDTTNTTSNTTSSISALTAESADLHQMFPATKDSCTVNRISAFNHLSTQQQSRAAGMQRVDRCINGLTARLMYKALGEEKTKQRAEGKKREERDRQKGRLLLDREQTGDDMDVSAAGVVLRPLWWKSNNEKPPQLFLCAARVFGLSARHCAFVPQTQAFDFDSPPKWRATAT
ncbi:unnamed protein product [Pleuronectes platessa]|uniref:Uncharacterized protein n=1 Tax=Pleuronectes platessa TaxID=8262 RepID=A0A9N7VNW8_PLEPL|nr:unnamed protein product [Pleuronectes platessa]